MKKSELVRARALKGQSQQALLPRKLSDSVVLSTLDQDAEEGEDVQIVKEAPQLTLHAFRVLKDINESEERGLVPRVLFDVFQQIKAHGHEVVAQCSFLQIYNEKIYDLFEDTSAETPLRLREDKQGAIQVAGLTHYTVQHEWDCLNLLRQGEKNRVTRQTQMNQRSSRSHSVF